MKTKFVKAGELKISMFCNQCQVSEIIRIIQQQGAGSIIAYKFDEVTIIQQLGGYDNEDNNIPNQDVDN